MSSGSPFAGNVLALLLVANVAFAALNFALLIARLRGGREAFRAFRAAARAAGWAVHDDGHAVRAQATVQGLSCVAWAQPAASGGPRYRVVVSRLLDAGFDGAWPSGAPLRARVPIPDRELQQRFDVQATAELVLTRLAGEARQALVALLAEGWTLTNDPTGIGARGPGTLVATHPVGVPDLPAAVEALATLANALAADAADDVPTLLLRRVTHEPRPALRLAALQMLLDQHRTRDETQRALAVARTATDVPLRLRALQEARAQGEQLLGDELVVLLQSPEESDRVDAIGRLATADPFPEAAVVACLRSAGDPATAVAAAELLVERGTRASLPALQGAARRIWADDDWHRLRRLHDQALAKFGISAAGGGLSVLPVGGGGLSLQEGPGPGALSKVTKAGS